jgi:lipoprotein-anchoring transpeptidase ErfK/SrfK
MQLHKLPKAAQIGLVTVLSVAAIAATYRALDRLGYIPPISLWRSLICTNCPTPAAYHQPPNTFIKSDRSGADLLSDRVAKSSISIFIEKSKYRLTIYRDKQPLKSYPIVLGDSPTGDKFNEGDRRTPEGIFQVKALYPHSQWSKFLWFDYPNLASWRKHLSAKQTGIIPWYKSIGRDVGIHGVPVNSDKLIDLQDNWTWGCISLKTADINEIYAVSRSGTLVEIVP